MVCIIFILDSKEKSFLILCNSLEMLFVIMNISHNAIRTHKWYNEKFEDYPKQRKAIIPFIL